MRPQHDPLWWLCNPFLNFCNLSGFTESKLSSVARQTTGTTAFIYYYWGLGKTGCFLLRLLFKRIKRTAFRLLWRYRIQVHQCSAGILTKPLQTQKKIYWLIKYKFPMATSSSLHKVFTSLASIFFQKAISQNGREKWKLDVGFRGI